MISEPRHLDISLRGKVALITGGSRGIGRSLALALAGSGAGVAIAARTQAQVSETVAAISQANGRSAGIVADVADRHAVERMIHEVENQLGPIDLLVNSAAVIEPLGPIAEADPEAWWRTQEINVRGPMLCARMVLPGMLARGGGRIINIVSTAGMMPILNMSAYLTSKVALIRFTELLALETSGGGIKAFAVNPGAVRTEMTGYLIGSPEGQQWTPWAGQQFDAGETPVEQVVSIVRTIATGRADKLSGRLISARDNLDEVIAHAGEIERDNLYTLRLDALPGVAAPVWSPQS